MICQLVLSTILILDAKKFNQCYMLARELGSGAFSVVKLGVNLVSSTLMHFQINADLSHHNYLNSLGVRIKNSS